MMKWGRGFQSPAGLRGGPLALLGRMLGNINSCSRVIAVTDLAIFPRVPEGEYDDGGGLEFVS